MAELDAMRLYESLLEIQERFRRVTTEYDKVIRTVGEVIYENEQLVRTIADMIEELHETPDLTGLQRKLDYEQKATNAAHMGRITLARFGAEKAEEGEAQTPIQA